MSWCGWIGATLSYKTVREVEGEGRWDRNLLMVMTHNDANVKNSMSGRNHPETHTCKHTHEREKERERDVKGLSGSPNVQKTDLSHIPSVSLMVRFYVVVVFFFFFKKKDH